MATALGSVILSSAQSVGKVYVIGAVGVLAATFPRKNVLLPVDSIGPIARFSFNVLTICLIYSTIARTTSMATIGSYWFEIVGNILVVAISYITATVMGWIIRIKNPMDFDALRIAASFPNIVALPILIFPALCEYPVVYQAFGGNYTECVNESTSKIFAYFFSWSLLFWTFGQSKLMASAKARSSVESPTAFQSEQSLQPQQQLETQQFAFNQEFNNQHSLVKQDVRVTTTGKEEQPSVEEDPDLTHSDNITVTETTTAPLQQITFWNTARTVFANTFFSPGFLAMMLGFITGCIPVLQEALFSQAGALRFIGSAIDTMGTASTSISTIVVAASLVPSTTNNGADVCNHDDPQHEPTAADNPRNSASTIVDAGLNNPDIAIMSDPNFGPGHALRKRRSSLSDVMMVVRRRSSQFVQIIQRSDRDMLRLHIWFFLSRLVVSPAIVSGTIVVLECTGVLSSVSNLSKMIIILNSALPGALIVVVMLKSQPEFSETAAVITKVYLTSYLLSIIPIAAWTSIGLYVSIPQEDGTSFCGT